MICGLCRVFSFSCYEPYCNPKVLSQYCLGKMERGEALKLHINPSQGAAILWKVYLMPRGLHIITRRIINVKGEGRRMVNDV